MKKLPLLLLLCVFSFWRCPNLSAQGRNIEWIKAGTKVVVELDQEVVSDDVAEGQAIKFKVTRPVYSENGIEVIRMNVSAIGHVKRIKEYEMEITIEATQSIGGMDVLIEGSLVRKRARRQCCVVFEKYTSIMTSVIKDTPVKH